MSPASSPPYTPGCRRQRSSQGGPCWYCAWLAESLCRSQTAGTRFPSHRAYVPPRSGYLCLHVSPILRIRCFSIDHVSRMRMHASTPWTIDVTESERSCTWPIERYKKSEVIHPGRLSSKADSDLLSCLPIMYYRDCTRAASTLGGSSRVCWLIHTSDQRRDTAAGMLAVATIIQGKFHVHSQEAVCAVRLIGLWWAASASQVLLCEHFILLCVAARRGCLLVIIHSSYTMHFISKINRKWRYHRQGPGAATPPVAPVRGCAQKQGVAAVCRRDGGSVCQGHSGRDPREAHRRN